MEQIEIARKEVNDDLQGLLDTVSLGHVSQVEVLDDLESLEEELELLDVVEEAARAELIAVWGAK